jgi:hypothetical protein
MLSRGKLEIIRGAQRGDAFEQPTLRLSEDSGDSHVLIDSYSGICCTLWNSGSGRAGFAVPRYPAPHFHEIAVASGAVNWL